MTDVLDQLRAAQPMPRGERLATWWMARHVASTLLRALGWSGVCARYASNRRWSRLGYESSLPSDADGIRRHARPLQLTRERAQRAEAEVARLRADVVGLKAEVDRLRALVRASSKNGEL